MLHVTRHSSPLQSLQSLLPPPNAAVRPFHTGKLLTIFASNPVFQTKSGQVVAFLSTILIAGYYFGPTNKKTTINIDSKNHVYVNGDNNKVNVR